MCGKEFLLENYLMVFPFLVLDYSRSSTHIRCHVDILQNHFWNVNKKIWNPYTRICLDETIVRFTGRCFHGQYIRICTKNKFFSVNFQNRVFWPICTALYSNSGQNLKEKFNRVLLISISSTWAHQHVEPSIQNWEWNWRFYNVVFCSLCRDYLTKQIIPFKSQHKIFTEGSVSFNFFIIFFKKRVSFCDYPFEDCILQISNSPQIFFFAPEIDLNWTSCKGLDLKWYLLEVHFFGKENDGLQLVLFGTST